MAELWKKVHAAIRKDPSRAAKKAGKPVRKVVTKAPALVQQDTKGRKWLRSKKQDKTIVRKQRAAIIKKAVAKFAE